MDVKPLVALTLEEAIRTKRIKIDRRSNSKRNLEPREGWFQDPDNPGGLFWRVEITDDRWAIYGHERMGWDAIGPGGWLTDDCWNRLQEITEKKTAVEPPKRPNRRSKRSR